MDYKVECDNGKIKQYRDGRLVQYQLFWELVCWLIGHKLKDPFGNGYFGICRRCGGLLKREII